MYIYIFVFMHKSKAIYMEFLHEETTEYASPVQSVQNYNNIGIYKCSFHTEGIVNEMNVGIDGRRISNRTEILRTFWIGRMSGGSLCFFFFIFLLSCMCML